MDSKPTIFGDLLKAYRGKADITLKGLAEKLDQQGYPITLDAISKYERGLRRPSGDFIYYLGKCFVWSPKEIQDALTALSSDYLEELTDQFNGVQKWKK